MCLFVQCTASVQSRQIFCCSNLCWEPCVTQYILHLREKEDRVDWLYSGPGTTINREDYLLGKKIDKLVDPTLIEQEREEMVTCLPCPLLNGVRYCFTYLQALAGGPGALFAAADTANTSTDLAAKIREDPLFIMK